MITTEALAKSIQQSGIPPVEDWDPAYCGELGLVIKADGTWLYQNTPFTRRKLQLLFAKVIRKEAADYFLVTPHEKLAIEVEWMPFTIIDFEVIQSDSHPIYRFIDNCDNSVELTELQQLRMSEYHCQQLPTINIRRNLFAGFSRSCYYRLISQAEVVETDKKTEAQLQSNGIRFSLGQFTEDTTGD